MTTHKDKRRWTSWRKENFKFLESALRTLPREAKVIDLGSGEMPFQELYKDFPNATFVDFHVTGEKMDKVDLNKNFPYANDSFDAVTATNTIEHILNLDLFLSEVYRILKPGGVFIGTVPFLASVHQAPYDFQRPTYYKIQAMSRGYAKSDIVTIGNPTEVLRDIQRQFLKRVDKKFKREILRRGYKLINGLIPKLQSDNHFCQGYAWVFVK